MAYNKDNNIMRKWKSRLGCLWLFNINVLMMSWSDRCKLKRNWQYWRVNSWSEEDKATYLAVILKGPALTVPSKIPQKLIICRIIHHFLQHIESVLGAPNKPNESTEVHNAQHQACKWGWFAESYSYTAAALKCRSVQATFVMLRTAIKSTKRNAYHAR